MIIEIKNYGNLYPTARKSGAFPGKCKIIPFPGRDSLTNKLRNPSQYFAKSQPVPDTIISAKPGDALPELMPDFRPQLQRDGLILLSWDKKITRNGELYTAYWVTSVGILRYYASPALIKEDFIKAMPNRKSYAAEDGIDFYGEPKPFYVVHVAPELMMSSREKKIQRPLHIMKLKALGISVDFNYHFVLSREKKRNLPDTYRAG